MVTDLRTGMLMTMRLTLSLTALALLTGCGTAPTPVPPPAPVAVETQLLALRPLDLVEILPASVTADRVVTLQARVAGLVTRIDAVPGTRVAAGTVIAHLDAAELDARSAQATAQAAQAAADLERATSLVARQALTPAEFDAAKARAAATAAAAKEATILVGYTTLTAPFEAVILRRHGQIDSVLVAEDGHARLRLVRLGEVSGTEVAIRAGLAAGERIILNAPGLADGSPITPR